MDKVNQGERWSDIMDDGSDAENLNSPAKRLKHKRVHTATIPTENKFALLANTTPETSNKSETTTVPKKPTSTKVRTPPITVVGKKRDEVIEMCCKAGVKENTFFLKLTSIGINILCNDVDSFTKLREQCKQTTECFSYDLASEKWLKIVLKGLFKMDIKDLKEELNGQGIIPEDIKLILPKKNKYDDQAHYLLFFKKGTVTINDLRKHRSLGYLRVDWEYYTPKKFGPTQCHKCQMFGHGSRHCTLAAKCLFCAGGHETRFCTSVVNGVPIEGFIFKCANCNGGHKANDESCPRLRRFLDIQETINQKNGNRNKQRVNPVTNTTPAEFPPLPTRPPLNSFRHSQPMTSRAPMSSLFRTQAPATFAVGTDASKGTHNNADFRRTTMFSGPELISIAQDVISTLDSCNTPDEQYLAIVNLAVKFLYGSP